ncbi:unnamed protein product [Psylliodes chrysocephalus]|uniref:DUF7869 domain-containing protein n=1 Tax=Psylliodes chrysocephalus TaxID=3402493 RepID=A0A9P0CHJ7_9CUCU|nr:unnamed protein product [Psylliodes chrysocephala]
MWEMFKNMHPGNKVSYEIHRTIFTTDFNIAFGYPRTDTCSTCDEYLAKIKSLEHEKQNASNENPVYTSPNKKQKIGRTKEDITAEIKQLTTLHDLHLYIRKLDLFCDSCGGQNKNYTFFRYLHNLVHQQKRFDSVRVTFPIRGHSYMENDKNMGIINQKARVETVKELCDLVQSTRKKPSSFVVEHLSEDNQHIFQKWTDLNKFYKKKASFPIQSIRQFEVSKEHPRLIKYRDTYNGTWTSAVVMDRKSMVLKNLETNNQFFLPEISYKGPIPISAANLQSLKKFCGKEAQDYFTSLVHN